MIITPTFVILIIVVFVLVFLFVNTIDKRKWLTFLVSLGLTPVIYFYVFYPLINIFSSYHHQKYFNAVAWQESPALRYEMSDDLINSSVLIGKSTEDVQTQLGKYEWLSWNEALKAHDSNQWNYGMGIEPGAFNEEKEILKVNFTNGTVSTVETYKEAMTFDE
ncbi:MAG: hypothetical protein BM564_02730 [Bacteroidetes bacterium MedPE-SWsnd-G2]|nr:MAG: hypothetical protein BM564_02730 [Bacteroidetes bacterium MedPE-SWsnd-G2]